MQRTIFSFSVLGSVNRGLHRLCGFLELGLKEIAVLGSVWFEGGGWLRGTGVPVPIFFWQRIVKAWPKLSVEFRQPIVKMVHCVM